MSVCVCACWFFFENTLTYIQRKKEKRRKKDNDNTKKKWTEMKEIIGKKNYVCICFLCSLIEKFSFSLFFSKQNLFVYCVDGGGIELFVIVGVIVAAQDNFLGMTVSGVGISWPVIVSGTIGVVASLLLFVLFVGSGLLAANLPWALATS